MSSEVDENHLFQLLLKKINKCIHIVSLRKKCIWFLKVFLNQIFSTMHLGSVFKKQYTAMNKIRSTHITGQNITLIIWELYQVKWILKHAKLSKIFIYPLILDYVEYLLLDPSCLLAFLKTRGGLTSFEKKGNDLG